MNNVSETRILTPEETQRCAEIAKALGDPVRMNIYVHLADNCCSTVCACKAPELFGISQPTFSHHVKKLVDAGLVAREQVGRWAHFSVIPEGLDPLRQLSAAVEVSPCRDS
ncbi:ArsR/SmtB family transcription factor [Corynebacterium alimapuense]|uniref:Transcriptional regulator n=1 Tax=Corynebacterium alimapuense TaxID=1576874 RepID=A0A3M8K909_9CORY|nr:metalloregulator ArsR/SmtB family transcription factor [Corynebacterium alimapuense]RNE49650.1 transcriptional regulator [Corynebacterium alimapuense]